MKTDLGEVLISNKKSRKHKAFLIIAIMIFAISIVGCSKEVQREVVEENENSEIENEISTSYTKTHIIIYEDFETMKESDGFLDVPYSEEVDGVVYSGILSCQYVEIDDETKEASAEYVGELEAEE